MAPAEKPSLFRLTPVRVRKAISFASRARRSSTARARTRRSAPGARAYVFGDQANTRERSGPERTYPPRPVRDAPGATNLAFDCGRCWWRSCAAPPRVPAPAECAGHRSPVPRPRTGGCACVRCERSDARIDRVLHELSDGLPQIALTTREPTDEVERIGRLELDRFPAAITRWCHRNRRIYQDSSFGRATAWLQGERPGRPDPSVRDSVAGLGGGLHDGTRVTLVTSSLASTPPASTVA